MAVIQNDWLTINQRLQVVKLALKWLKDEEPDAYQFAAACCVIEGYLAYGGTKTLKHHRPKKVNLTVVDFSGRSG